MESRSNKKKKDNSDVVSPPPSADSISSADFRNWSDLSEDLLLPIAHRLSSIPDLLSFAAACRSWRSVAANASSPFSGPPLLLTPVLSHQRRPRWSGPRRCHLKTLTRTPITDDNRPRAYEAMLDSGTLRNKCLGCSFGHLVFAVGDKAVLANAFTGDKIASPKFPPLPGTPRKFRIGILTAPPSSSSCALLLVAQSCTLFWRIDSNAWVREEYLRHGLEIRSLAVWKGLIYCLDDRCRVKVVDFNHFVCWRTLELELPTPQTSTLLKIFRKYLVECGGELLLVLFATQVGGDECQIDVFKLDFSEVKWVKKENLGDWCLFVDVVGNRPVACLNPARWGGRSNCVYVTGPGCESWSVYSLDGSEIYSIAGESALSSLRRELLGWPSPIWVYPSLQIGAMGAPQLRATEIHRWKEATKCGETLLPELCCLSKDVGLDAVRQNCQLGSIHVVLKVCSAGKCCCWQCLVVDIDETFRENED